MGKGTMIGNGRIQGQGKQDLGISDLGCKGVGEGLYDDMTVMGKGNTGEKWSGSVLAPKSNFNTQTETLRSSF